ncbi:unnamed protein product [Darwinula stevensoni]|uniref:Uncharacterized protein n=1 Tax=Darwinula stevensoni TaxID=69355 RepID=A0A7R9A2S6_9CRUS|nr:unnamed protein product [Darwinula stevensoni]CAG0880112.1 unnamed protein product [Darwinula stevensoni]
MMKWPFVRYLSGKSLILYAKKKTAEKDAEIILGVTDGKKVWIASLQDANQPFTSPEIVRENLEQGKYEVTQKGEEFLCQATGFTKTLTVAGAKDSQEDIQMLLLHLASISPFAQQEKRTERTAEFVKMPTRGGKDKASPVKKQPGMSLVNPSSKRIKKAAGVQFTDS